MPLDPGLIEHLLPVAAEPDKVLYIGNEQNPHAYTTKRNHVGDLIAAPPKISSAGFPRDTVPIDASQLAELANIARRQGTEFHFTYVAIQWAVGADLEIRRLRERLREFEDVPDAAF